MKRIRFRLSTLCWLVAVVAAFLGGIRYGEYRSQPRKNYHVVRIAYSPGEDTKSTMHTAILR